MSYKNLLVSVFAVITLALSAPVSAAGWTPFQYVSTFFVDSNGRLMVAAKDWAKWVTPECANASPWAEIPGDTPGAKQMFALVISAKGMNKRIRFNGDCVGNGTRIRANLIQIAD